MGITVSLSGVSKAEWRSRDVPSQPASETAASKRSERIWQLHVDGNIRLVFIWIREKIQTHGEFWLLDLKCQ